MDRGSGFQQACTCRRTFSSLAAFRLHRKSCKASRSHLSKALARAKGVYAARNTKDTSCTLIVGSEDLDNQSGSLLDNENSQVLDPVQPIQVPGDARPTKRQRRLPSRFRVAGLELHDKRLKDILPQPVQPLPPPGMDADLSTITDAPTSAGTNSSDSFNNRISAVRTGHRQFLKTTRNAFGLFRRYYGEKLPSHDPEREADLLALSNVIDAHAGLPPSSPDVIPSFGPFPNKSSFQLSDWYWNHGVQKSREDFRELLSIVGDDDFRPEDVRTANWNKINNDLGVNHSEEEWMDEDAGWTASPVTISVPFHRLTDNPGARDYTIAAFHHRSLVSVIREKIKRPSDHPHFHYEPYELFWQPNDNLEETRVHSEIYSSPAFIAAHNNLQNSPHEPGCDLPRVVVALMFWSDATHLTNFGNAKLWPLYMFFGNESKYRRSKPSANLCEHVAYFESLPDSFKDFASKYTGSKKLKQVFMAHCRRELTHAQWKILLNEEFLHAYKHGIVIECCDGVLRRFYPRFFTYSADYIEKILMAGIRTMGKCPCPRCTIPKSKVHLVGTKRDSNNRVKLARVDDEGSRYMVSQARKEIYGRNFDVDSAGVERILKPKSLVPASNAFSDLLSQFGFNRFSVFVVDLMHEIELGVWKQLFIHLLRVLDSANENLLHELDRRFRLIPTFGRDTIRRFTSNSSELKNMAARNYEDFLQCAIPVFEGLLPEPHNTKILQLLFTLAHWHGLAKLRMHTDATLAVFNKETFTLGQQLRNFQSSTCAAYPARELRRELDSRIRRQARQRSMVNGSGENQQDVNQRRPKTLNLQTYKVHSLGDYLNTIATYGTTDSYTSAIGELEHRKAKARYTRTSKKDVISQLTRIERRQARLRAIGRKLSQSSPRVNKTEAVNRTIEAHHHIGVSENFPVHIGSFLGLHAGDPAVNKFWPKLKKHLLPRIRAALDAEGQAGCPSSPTCSGRNITGADPDMTAGLDGIHFKRDHMYQHKIMNVNYTTYDVRRAQDTINSNTDHNIVMLLSAQDDGLPSHQYLYARVIGIYHVNVIYTGPGMLDYSSRRMEFLWVRWLTPLDDEPVQSSWGRMRLDRLAFPLINADDSFGFVDPGDVLRGSHLIPRFAGKLQHEDGVGLSECARDSNDWCQYYVGRFVDRDMVLRYHWGLAVGHIYSHCASTTDENNTAVQAEDPEEDAYADVDDAENLSSDSDPDYEPEDEEDHDDNSEFSYEDGCSDGDGDDYDDAEFLEMYEMYGDSQDIDVYE